MSRQGRGISDATTAAIARLLRETDLSMALIARRFGLSVTAVKHVNDREHIRRNVNNFSWYIGDRLVTAEKE